MNENDCDSRSEKKIIIREGFVKVRYKSTTERERKRNA